MHERPAWPSSDPEETTLTRAPRERIRLVPYISGIFTIFAFKHRKRYGQTAYRKELCLGLSEIHFLVDLLPQTPKMAAMHTDNYI